MIWIAYELNFIQFTIGIKVLSTKLMDDSRYSKQHISVFRPHEEDKEYI